MVRNISFTRNGRVMISSNENGCIFIWTC